MDALLSIGKAIDAPGSIQFLILCILVGFVVMFVWPRNRRAGRLWLFFVSASYLLLGMPLVAHTITGLLPRFDADSIRLDRPLDALVVFDGDNRRGRLSEAGRIYRDEAPSEVWVLGSEEEWLREHLPSAGIPAGIVRHDAGTLNTRDQMAWVRRYVSGADVHVAIVASRLQMPRVAALAAAAEVDAALVASPVDDEPPVTGARVLMPMHIALRVSRDALYEHAALLYYRQKGWIGG